MTFQDHPDLAVDDAEAERRFLLAEGNDPFPEIAHALLNSADVSDYVRMTGMLYPFHRGKLKSGSYEAAIRGQCICWDENEERQDKFLEEENKDEFVLKANSIAFVQVEPLFRLPAYIALRFNLKIKHVHRGILLGTGPLIDPGFVGQLLIPLHNLTTNEYRFKCGEGLIWIEFTKTSPLPGADHGSKNALGLIKRGTYVPFDKSKRNLAPDDYLVKSSPHKPIRSSIPEAVRESQVQATKSANAAKWARNTVVAVTSIGGFIFLLTLAGVTYQTWSLIQETWKIVEEVQQKLRLDIERDKGVVGASEEAQQKIQSLDQRFTDKLTALEKQIDRLGSELRSLRIRSGSDKQEEQRRGSESGESRTR